MWVCKHIETIVTVDLYQVSVCLSEKVNIKMYIVQLEVAVSILIGQNSL